MTKRFFTKHKGWEIHATARELSDGQFAPAVDIVRVDGEDSFEHALTVLPDLAFDSEGGAANHAIRFAMRHIDAGTM